MKDKYNLLGAIGIIIVLAGIGCVNISLILAFVVAVVGAVIFGISQVGYERRHKHPPQ